MTLFGVTVCFLFLVFFFTWICQLSTISNNAASLSWPPTFKQYIRNIKTNPNDVLWRCLGSWYVFRVCYFWQTSFFNSQHAFLAYLINTCTDLIHTCIHLIHTCTYLIHITKWCITLFTKRQYMTSLWLTDYKKDYKKTARTLLGLC